MTKSPGSEEDVKLSPSVYGSSRSGYKWSGAWLAAYNNNITRHSVPDKRLDSLSLFPSLRKMAAVEQRELGMTLFTSADCFKKERARARE